jgi:hypothetical protein
MGCCIPLRWGCPICRNSAATQDGAAKLRNGNPGHVLPGDVEYGDLAWASLDGQPVAVGRFRAGDCTPSGFSTCEPDHHASAKDDGPVMITRSFQKGDAASPLPSTPTASAIAIP